ncbi:MAG: hypothetical protein Q9P44_17220, partial [Anaerolineae bacterium]|nr:hypothetical protein [Anaerolineae bacterium]
GLSHPRKIMIFKTLTAIKGLASCILLIVPIRDFAPDIRNAIHNAIEERYFASFVALVVFGLSFNCIVLGS